MAMRKSKIWAEMARRKVMFHKTESWNSITLWGLFNWGDISKYIKSGELITNDKKENIIVWVRPSLKAWKENIEPLIEKYTLNQLSSMAGW